MAVDLEPPLPSASRPFLELRALLRAPGIASDSRKLILATLGLLALHGGWIVLGFLFDLSKRPLGSSPTFDRFLAIDGLFDLSIGGFWAAAREIATPFLTLTSPFASMFRPGQGPGGWVLSALMALWAVIVWGIAGGAIARVAVVQAATGSRVGLGTALRFALGKASSLIGAPLTPMLAVAILSGGCAAFGLLYRLPGGVGGVVTSALGFVPLMLGLVMALILVGLALGWPLMHATIAAEGEDAPDALSRSYSYVNQRLVRYGVHAALAWLIGAVGWLAVVIFARVVLSLADWGVSLGAPGFEQIGELAVLGRLFWAKVVGLLVTAWAYSYFWSAASILYLILRRDVDGTDWHDVYLPDQDADTFAADPEVKESAPAATAAP
jgi:hypothetical protein